MSRVRVRIQSPLRSPAIVAGEVVVQGATAREALAELERVHPGSTAQVLDERGELRRSVSLLVGARTVRAQVGLDTPLAEGTVLSVLPVISGSVCARRRARRRARPSPAVASKHQTRG